ncbi:COR domain-containing protein [Desulfococcaceae bacterium HSG8]|nr:COR domain-containing protein [Desulfococcaceae bacterium HSG8]
MSVVTDNGTWATDYGQLSRDGFTKCTTTATCKFLPFFKGEGRIYKLLYYGQLTKDINKMIQEELLEIIHKAEKEQVTELDLSEYEIPQLPPEIGRLTSLQILILRGLKELPGEIAQLRNLTRLYLNSNELKELPGEIAQLRNLDILDLSSNELTELTGEIAQLKNLTRLYLNSNALTELPKEIAQLKKLNILYLSFNQLTELPPEIARLRNLSILYLSANQLEELPREIAHLRNLTELNLSYNQLERVPREIAQLRNLTRLDLGSNQLEELPGEIAQFRNLTELDLSSNQLERLPKEIAHLRNLTELNLSSNELEELPREIAQAKNLTRLYLSFNHLNELPREIGQLDNLNILDLSSNELKELPGEISQLRELSVLYVDSNQLSTLPREIVKLEKLIHLDLNKNPLTFPPLEIASQGLSAIKEYLEKSGRGGQTLYEGKIMIVGQGGVGKTCLIKRLIQNEFGEKQTTTEGIDIHTWKLGAPDKSKTQMKLNVWDFGGQEIYHATHQFFLTQRSLYILVWDARQEEEYGRIDYWLNAIETFAEDSPVMIVMNKCDERNKDINLSELKKRCPQIIASAKVSAKGGIGIEALRKFIRRQAWKLPLMGTFWPSSWLKVRKALQDTYRYHIPYKKYLQVCRKVEIDENEANTLSRYLHDLGLILHFQDDPLLKQTVILKPEWGTDAVYKVLDAKPVQENNGILKLKDLAKIWSDRKLYPKEKYATILQLMANFELAFPFGEGNRYIVAEFLSPKEVEYDWNPRTPLRFEYHYDFLPAGVITRLIVRMHEFLTEYKGEKLCWREGAYFEQEETRAMVKIHPYTRIAMIQIDGTAKREFLAIFRSHFAAIHKSIRKIRFKEKIPCACTSDCKHRFDYSFLLKCEEKGIRKVLCEKNAEYINVRKVLDSIEQSEVRHEKRARGSDDKYQPRRADPVGLAGENLSGRLGTLIQRIYSKIKMVK